MEVCLETRQDLIELLKTSPYDFIILKFKADWCRPCKVIEPFVHDLVDKKIAQLDKENKKDVFLYVEVDVDVCFDLYDFLRQKKTNQWNPGHVFILQNLVQTTRSGISIHSPIKRHWRKRIGD